VVSLFFYYFRIVFGLEDEVTGGVLGRLEIDSSSLPSGYKPFHKTIKSQLPDFLINQQVALSFRLWSTFNDNYDVRTYLKSNTAQLLFEMFPANLREYDVVFVQNLDVFKEALEFFESFQVK